MCRIQVAVASPRANRAAILILLVHVRLRGQKKSDCRLLCVERSKEECGPTSWADDVHGGPSVNQQLGDVPPHLLRAILLLLARGARLVAVRHACQHQRRAAMGIDSVDVVHATIEVQEGLGVADVTGSRRVEERCGVQCHVRGLLLVDAAENAAPPSLARDLLDHGAARDDRRLPPHHQGAAAAALLLVVVIRGLHWHQRRHGAALRRQRPRN
mmetsp:Transcript_5262/g.19804  ORF Transcript_5262/g.19804 Transcript_5262/m.19804 type:complete len:214 (+) Transcript_5262:391-1032(+)